jgi:catechol 2,3-dioxygenase-like lactoylglutathione lyase family enzyme
VTAVGGVSELRVVITVDDYDAAVALYRDTLGMPQIADYSAPTERVIGPHAHSLEEARPRHHFAVDSRTKVTASS